MPASGGTRASRAGDDRELCAAGRARRGEARARASSRSSSSGAAAARACAASVSPVTIAERVVARVHHHRCHLRRRRSTPPSTNAPSNSDARGSPDADRNTRRSVLGQHTPLLPLGRHSKLFGQLPALLGSHGATQCMNCSPPLAHCSDKHWSPARQIAPSPPGGIGAGDAAAVDADVGAVAAGARCTAGLVHVIEVIAGSPARRSRGSRSRARRSRASAARVELRTVRR